MYQDYYTRPELYCNGKEEPIESMEYNVAVDPSMLLSSNTSPSSYMMLSTLHTAPQQQQQETDDSWWAINNNNCDNSALSSPTELSLSHPSPSYSPYSDSISQPSPIDTSFEYYPQSNFDVVTPNDYYYSYAPQPLVINTTTSCGDLCGCYATTTNNTTTPTSMSPQSVYEETPSLVGISPLPVMQPEIVPVPPPQQQQQQPVQQQRSNSISSAHSGHIPLGSNNHSNNNNNNDSLRPYPCYLCSRAFARKHDLQRHIRVHTGAKPYSCLCCKKAFARTDALKRHLRMEEACRTSPEIQAMKCAGKRRYRNL